MTRKELAIIRLAERQYRSAFRHGLKDSCKRILAKTSQDLGGKKVRFNLSTMNIEMVYDE